MHKRILNSEETRDIAKKAIASVAAVVKQTLGPAGNPIIIQRAGTNPDGSPLGPLITKDGVTVAENTSLRDPALDTVVKAIMEVAQKTVKDGGDGTTTSVVLAEAIYNAGYKLVEQGSNGIELYNELNNVKDFVIAELNLIKKDIKEQDVLNVAKISANGDEEIAKIVFDALQAAGEDGYVSLEEGYTKDTVLDTVDGAVYKRGWRNFAPNGALLVNDKSKNICDLANPAVLIFAGKLENIKDLEVILDKVWKRDEQSNVYTDVCPLMLIAHDYSDDLKNRILQVRVQGKLPIAAIKSPADGSPNARTEMLEDLAALLGASVFAKGILEIDSLEDNHLGTAERVEIGMEETIFYGYAGDKEEIMRRIGELNILLENPNLHPFDAENIRFRKGKLSGGIAIVKVGGKSELEMREKKDRIEDALCAAKAAIQDGVLPGGGYALYRISQKLKKLNKNNSKAVRIMEEALTAPIRQIIINCGLNPDLILSKMPKNKGYDAKNKKYTDLIKSGIIDPAKVTKSALENAVSIAGLLLTTGGALVSDIQPDDGKPNPFAAMMGM